PLTPDISPLSLHDALPICAGAAIALRAAFLGSGAAQVLAQKLKDRAGRVDGIERDDVAVEREANRRAAVRRLRLLPRHCEVLSRSEEHTSELQSRGHLVCR